MPQSPGLLTGHNFLQVHDLETNCVLQKYRDLALMSNFAIARWFVQNDLSFLLSREINDCMAPETPVISTTRSLPEKEGCTQR
jgi:hypothetical protein